MSEYQFAGKQTQMPEAFTTWMKDNEQRIANAKSLPYFIKDNYKDGNPAKGLRWAGQAFKKETAKQRIFRMAAGRHAVRTDKQVDKIQYTWDMHRLDTYNVKIDALKKKLKGSTSPNNKLNALKKREAAITDAILKHKSVAETQNLMARYEHGVEIQEAWNKILWDGFSKEQIDNCQKIENKLGILKGRRMNIEGADKQSANPNFIEKYIPKKGSGMFITIDGKRIEVIANKKWTASNENEYHINCATCAPTYVLREFGFNIFAKGRHATKHNDDIAYGKLFSVWRNKDGSVCNQKTYKAWLDKNKYKNMTPKRYRAFFEEMTQDEGTYILNIGWKGGGGHATILKRKSDGSLVYIEPQHYYGETIGVERPIDSLCEYGGQQPGWRRGIMRVDDKIFDTDWIDIFGHN